MAKQSKSTTTPQAKSASITDVNGDRQDAASLLTADHRNVEQLFEQCDRYSPGGGRVRGHGGWYSDPAGHSRASEEGWENRRGR